MSAKTGLDLASAGLEFAGDVIGILTGRHGDGGDGETAERSRPEPAAWRGPGASSTSAPSDAPAAPAAGPGPASAQRSPATPRVNGSGGTTSGETTAPQRTEDPARPGDRPPEIPTVDDEAIEAEVTEILEADREEAAVDYDAPASPEPAHVSEEVELVEEVSEPGAEDGAGAQIHVAEPWDGYRTLKAAEVIDRLSSASREELAAVELYEMTARKRKSVLSAVERLLKQASPPQ